MPFEKLSHNAVNLAIMDCLFRDDEIDRAEAQAGIYPDNAIMVEGIVSKFLLNLDRPILKDTLIRDWIRELDPKFHVLGGGGWSFLQLPFTGDGRQWGEQADAQALVVMSIALGFAKYQMPRAQWGLFPGGVPYIVFDPDHVVPDHVKTPTDR